MELPVRITTLAAERSAPAASSAARVCSCGPSGSRICKFQHYATMGAQFPRIIPVQHINRNDPIQQISAYEDVVVLPREGRLLMTLCLHVAALIARRALAPR